MFLSKPFHPATCNCADPQRRRLLQMTLAGALALLPEVSLGNAIRQQRGSAWVNGHPVSGDANIRPGDMVRTGADGHLQFVVGKDAYLMRPNSDLRLETDDGALVHTLRLISGGLLAAFGRGEKRILTRTATVGIRGTAVYLEAQPAETYFCLCYGAVELQANGQPASQLSAGHHAAKRIGQSGLTSAEMENHSDAELDLLEGLVGRVPYFRKASSAE